MLEVFVLQDSAALVLGMPLVLELLEVLKFFF